MARKSAIPAKTERRIRGTRLEENHDYTDTWGAHLLYRRPLSAAGWTIGWSLTGNRKDHPKIPNYEIQNIPRDPGNTRAYAAGVGLSKSQGPIRFGVDLVLEPIRSETWADAASDTTSVKGEIIAVFGGVSQVGQFVHEADLGRQHGVRRILGQLGGTNIHRNNPIVVAIEWFIQCA